MIYPASDIKHCTFLRRSASKHRSSRGTTLRDFRPRAEMSAKALADVLASLDAETDWKETVAQLAALNVRSPRLGQSQLRMPWDRSRTARDTARRIPSSSCDLL
jgi:hypothetical protein